ncbi:NADH-quinone oxidoreductase subunit E [Neotabrizicola shimadae]|uniref:NADH-quinone oxidoreductase subunit E n=1 Tax=Neotabrizicola shimadae TaxID=2807096 RepID=A0A8G0ZTB1_9RHOB|nr:NADH-quinone oxidoreductase subunit E [Neotabrizicola shimadae]QYZ71026.1 NADH-quinone oxidoreductase subunit E [Neotabrizicola shimadae]
MLRRLHHTQPESFAFTPANLEWAKGQISKYPEGRQASAVIPLLWRAQEQEGWLSRPAIEFVADMLGMAYIRALEVATFYFMFQLQPVGSVAHIQICGTTSCMICGAEELIAVCRELIAKTPHTLSADGRFSWEEVECMGACANAPMAQIGKDYYEDLSAEKLRELIARFGNGEVPVPGSQIGRYAAEPASGLTSLKDHEAGKSAHSATVALAVKVGDTAKRIDGTEVPILTPWLKKSAAPKASAAPAPAAEPTPAAAAPAKLAEVPATEAPAKAPAKPAAPANMVGTKPKALGRARRFQPDDLKVIEGIGPKMEEALNGMGYFHYDQIASWTPEEVAWIDENLPSFKGRASRDRWVAQAKLILEVGVEEFLVRAKTNDY